MSWFLIALVTPALHAVANHTDKYLISKYFKVRGVGALVIFSALFAVIALPIILFFKPALLDISSAKALILALNGTLIVVATLCYLYALQADEASIVVPFFQIVPIFGFILGYLVLGEVVSNKQIIGALIIIAGAILLSWERVEGQFRLRQKVVLLMIAASLCYAVNGVIFKLLTVQEGFWTSTFWELVGKIILGLGLLLFVRHYRQSFLEIFRTNKASVLAINSANEGIILVGDFTQAFALLLAPIGLVLTVSSLQPLFVFIIGVFLTLFLPTLGHETINRPTLIKKTLAIILVVIGSGFLV